MALGSKKARADIDADVIADRNIFRSQDIGEAGNFYAATQRLKSMRD